MLNLLNRAKKRHEKTRVALTIGHGLLREGFSAMMDDCGCMVTGAYETGIELVRNTDASHIPDIVFIDAHHEKEIIVQIGRWFRDHFPVVRLLALVTKEEEDDISTLLANGFHGYISTTAMPEEIKEAVRALIHRGYYHPTLIFYDIPISKIEKWLLRHKDRF